MQAILKHTSILGLILGLAALAPRDAAAQETQTRDTTAPGAAQDTGQAQNPPGYRGMERPTNVFPPDSGSADSAGQVEDRATGTYDDSTRQDTSQSRQNPAGYRRMERAAGRDTGATSADTAMAGEDSTMAGRDSASVLPGDSSSITPSTPADRLNPTDSAGTQGP